MKFIIGVVDSRGVSAGTWKGKELWNVSFRFAYWYSDNMEVQSSELYVSKDVEETEVRELMDKITRETIIKISYEGEIKSKSLNLLDVLEVDVDDLNLQKQLEEVRNVVTYEDALGIFTFDKSISNYNIKMVWCGAEVNLVIETDSEAELIHLIKDYKQNFGDKNLWDKKVKNFAASELTELKNDCWIDEDEETITESEFASLISLETLVIYPDRTYTFWFNDGDIFFGHVIIVYGDLDKGFERAEMGG